MVEAGAPTRDVVVETMTNRQQNLCKTASQSLRNNSSTGAVLMIFAQHFCQPHNCHRLTSHPSTRTNMSLGQRSSTRRRGPTSSQEMLGQFWVVVVHIVATPCFIVLVKFWHHSRALHVNICCFPTVLSDRRGRIAQVVLWFLSLSSSTVEFSANTASRSLFSQSTKKQFIVHHSSTALGCRILCMAWDYPRSLTLVIVCQRGEACSNDGKATAFTSLHRAAHGTTVRCKLSATRGATDRMRLPLTRTRSHATLAAVID